MHISEDDLFKDSVRAEKPDKENAMNASYRFPKYIYGKISEIQLCKPTNSSIKFINQEIEDKNLLGFKIYPERILTSNKTTCMIKNIPNKFTINMLIDFLNQTHFGRYDFLYLRMDFKNKCNVGYAFVNFVSVKDVQSFYKRISGKGWKNFTSSKIAELTYASIQGIDKLIEKFRNSSIMHEDKSFRPKLFYTSGILKGMEKQIFE